MLGCILEDNHCKAPHAETDADVLIATTAIASSQQDDTVLVGDDTDLLIVLCARVKTSPYRIFFHPEPRSYSKNPPCC